MPEINKGESRKDYVSRCISIVMGEGKAENAEQAAAICHSKYDDGKARERFPKTNKRGE